MLSQIRQREAICTFDTEQWHLEDPLPPLHQDEPLHLTYGLNIATVAREKRDMDEWHEAWGPASVKKKGITV